MQTARKREIEPSQEIVKVEIQRKKRKAGKKNPALFWGVMMFLGIFMRISMEHLKLQSQITTCIKNTNRIQAEYWEQKEENDEEYKRLSNAYNINEIRDMAINELGMSYPTEGQIIYYDMDGNDYVRQYAEIPEE